MMLVVCIVCHFANINAVSEKMQKQKMLFRYVADVYLDNVIQTSYQVNRGGILL